jgi:hypothetical protein
MAEWLPIEAGDTRRVLYRQRPGRVDLADRDLDVGPIGQRASLMSVLTAVVSSRRRERA